MPSAAAEALHGQASRQGRFSGRFPGAWRRNAMAAVSEMNTCRAALEHLVHMGASCSHAIDEKTIAMTESGGGGDLARLGLMETRRRAERMNAGIWQALVPFDAGAPSARIADTSAPAVW